MFEDGEWTFRIVKGRFRVGRCSDIRPGVELFVLDDKRHMIVPISSQKGMFKPKKHFAIDKNNPAFVATKLDPAKDSYVVEDEAMPLDAVDFIVGAGRLSGTLAEKYVFWSGRSLDKRLKRKIRDNPRLLEEFCPWVDDPKLYVELTQRNPRIEVGKAFYDPQSGKIHVPTTMWPSWYYWVWSRAQQAWDSWPQGNNRREWKYVCQNDTEDASRLLDMWLGLRGLRLNVTSESDVLRTVFAEACVVVFAHNEPSELGQLMRDATMRIGRDLFWF